MNLPEFSVRHQPIVITFVILLLVWGGISYQTMPRREDPEYTVRTCAVLTKWDGAPAQKVEELVTDKIEKALDTIEEVDVIRSTSTNGLSEIYVDVEDRVSGSLIDNVWDKVRAEVSRVSMPDPNIRPVVNDSFGDTSILVLAVSQTPLQGEDKIREENRYTRREIELVCEDIRDSLRLLDGVSKVELFGNQQEAIYLETDIGNWSQIDLTVDDLKKLLEARNIVASGGTIESEVGRYFVKPGGEFDSTEEIKSIIINTGSESGATRPVYLKDAGITLRRDYEDPPSRICRFGDAHRSTPAVIVALQMKSGANIVDICDAANARLKEMKEIEQSLPEDISVVPVSDQSTNVRKKISDVVSNVIGAIVIVVLIVFIFVGFRTAMVMAANIPVVVLASLALITVFEVQLEQISLASIIIALGLLVDNAVQVCDQARTNQLNGMDPTTAAVNGANTLSMAMLSGTATTVAAFFPMLLALEGNTYEYIYSLPVTLSVTLGISWVLAMTFCVILAAWFIRAPKDPSQPSAPIERLFALGSRLFRKKTQADPVSQKSESLIARTFGIVAGTAIRLKVFTISVSFLLLAWALQLDVGSEFFPKDLRDQFAVQIWLPENATIEQTDQAAQQVEAILRELSHKPADAEGNPERIQSMRTIVGGGGSRWYLSWSPEGTKANYAEILVRTNDPLETSWLASRLREVAESGDVELGMQPVAGARVVPRELFLGPSTDPVALRLSGLGFADMQQLGPAAAKLKALVRNQPGTWDVYDTWGIPAYQIRVDLDQAKANLAGVTNANVAQSLNAYYSGQQLTVFREGDHQVPVYLKLRKPVAGTSDSPFEERSLTNLKTTYVEGTREKVPLGTIAKIVPRWETARIERRDLNRVIEVRSQVETGFRGNDIVKAILTDPEFQKLEASLPPGFFIEVGGSLEDSQEGSEQLAVCLGISLLSIVLILVVQYNGWAKPTIILMTLPLALIGALPGLYFTSNPLGFMPQLGILSLFGIVLNTGIIFIEFADQLVGEGMKSSGGDGPVLGMSRSDFYACLVNAGRQRLMPIFLTTSTTIGGLLPLAVAGGPLWEGMAWCMIFGLIVATLLTLLVVPAFYAFFVEYVGMKPVSTALAGETPSAQPLSQ